MDAEQDEHHVQNFFLQILKQTTQIFRASQKPSPGAFFLEINTFTFSQNKRIGTWEWLRAITFVAEMMTNLHWRRLLACILQPGGCWSTVNQASWFLAAVLHGNAFFFWCPKKLQGSPGSSSLPAPEHLHFPLQAGSSRGGRCKAAA